MNAQEKKSIEAELTPASNVIEGEFPPPPKRRPGRPANPPENILRIQEHWSFKTYKLEQEGKYQKAAKRLLNAAYEKGMSRGLYLALWFHAAIEPTARFVVLVKEECEPYLEDAIELE